MQQAHFIIITVNIPFTRVRRCVGPSLSPSWRTTDVNVISQKLTDSVNLIRSSRGCEWWLLLPPHHRGRTTNGHTRGYYFKKVSTANKNTHNNNKDDNSSTRCETCQRYEPKRSVRWSHGYCDVALRIHPGSYYENKRTNEIP